MSADPSIDLAAVAAAPELVQPSPEERRSGWTAETLTAYLRQRAREQRLTILGPGASLGPGAPPFGPGTGPARCDGRYDPWAC